MDAADLDDVLAAVGPRLRTLRHRRDVTLVELSARTGISQSTLSRLESGGRRATLELLLPLARAYAVPLDVLVGAPRTGDPRVHLQPMVRRGMTFVPLGRRPGGVQAFKIIIPASWHDEEDHDPQTHVGHQWLFVLDGRLRLVLDGAERVLGPGDMAEFDTRVPHNLLPADPGAVEAIALFGPGGQRPRPVERSAREDATD